MQGKIIKGIAGFYYIHVETSGIYECMAIGIFRNRHIKPLVGDNVEIEVIDKDNFKGNVVDILPRKNELIRPASANIDQAMVIFAVKTPEPNFNLLDKFILMMNYQDVPTVVCFNKEELADDEYFVMGANRNNSSDSRTDMVGNIKRENIIGKAWLRIWPVSDFGVLQHQ